MITIIGYGLGNVSAFASMYKRMNIDAKIATHVDELAGAQRLILPGVGSFDHAMDLFDNSGMRDTVERMVLEEGVPVLGVCVGMQILANRSDEGNKAGLGWIEGEVHHMARTAGGNSLPMPHMGWNDVKPRLDIPLFDGLQDDARFYFLHSFYFEAHQTAHVSATAEYGQDFTCGVSRGNVHGVQFHPEKSHHWGATLLKNFAVN